MEVEAPAETGKVLDLPGISEAGDMLLNARTRTWFPAGPGCDRRRG